MKFKVTHVYMHQLTETSIRLDNWGELVNVLEGCNISPWTVLKVEMIPVRENPS